MNAKKILVLAVLVMLVAAYYVLDLERYLTLQFAQQQLASVQSFRDENFLLVALLYFIIYVVAVAVSIPGGLLLTLMGGAVFGLGWGVLLVSFASSLGATLAFLASRAVLRDWVQEKFGDYLAPINRGIEKDGTYYLFSIRLVPIIPFFMVNLLMGLTPLRVVPYYMVSQIGMLPATAIFVNAGSELASINSLSGMLSGSVLLSFTLLAIFPWLARWLMGRVQRIRALRRYPRPASFDTNVVVIGAGSAGLVASLIVAGAKAKVTLVEEHRMGGDCLNTGCVPSKALIRSGRIAAYLRRAEEYGLGVAQPQVDFAAVMEQVQGVIRAIEPHDSIARFTSLGVDCVQGKARVVSPYQVDVNGRVINTRAIIIATGARPLVPPMEGLDQVDYVTSDTIWQLREQPRELLVVGGGAIGCELAQAFGNLGTRVTVLDLAERILPREDAEVSEALARQFAAQGIRVLTGYRIRRFRRVEGMQLAEAVGMDSSIDVHFDTLLLALGRRPNVEGFGLEDLGIALTRQGALEVDEYLQTSCPTIYACGDVVGPFQFTHMASYQAWFAALNAMLGGLRRSRVDYRVVPWAVFTDPELARVGLNELEARERGVPFEVTRYELDHFDRALADREARGFVKVLTVPGKDRILGATIVGYHAGELIAEFVFAMTHGMGLKKIAATTHVYPTLMEANRFAANAWRSARLPVRLFPYLERFFRWQRRR